jgi:hypothetical protein
MESGFVEFASHEGFDFIESLMAILAFTGDLQFAAGTGGQHHQPHNALAVDLLAVLIDQDIAGEAIDEFDKEGGRAGMDAQLVDHNKFALRGLFAAWFLCAAHAVPC